MLWTRTRRRPVLPVAAATVLALGLAGCDIDGDDGDATVEDADGVVVSDEDDDTAVVVDEADGTAVVEGSDEAAAALAEAVAATRGVDARTAFEASVTSGVGSEGVIGEGVVDGDDLAATMTVRGDYVETIGGAADAEVEVRVVDGTTYLGWPALLADAGFDAAWLQLTDDSEEIGGFVRRALLTSPEDSLSLLDGVTNVAQLDDEFVDEESTAHYVATVTLADAIAASGVGSDVFADVGGEADRAIEVHVYVGADGLVRRMEADHDRDGATVLLRVDVLDADVDVDVEQPEADDTVSWGEFVAARG